jgi:beta-glucosidase
VYLAREDVANGGDGEYPVRWLAGFCRVEVAAGDERTVTIRLAPRAFAAYHGGWCAEPGRFQVLVGGCVTDQELASTITIV